MSKEFLTPIKAPKVEITEVPFNNTDSTNKEYVDMVSVPPGGALNQVLTKNSNDDYDTVWQNVSGSSGTYTGIDIDMGSFLDPNGFIDCGGF